MGTYTFFATATEADDRVKLWVDNQLLVDQWSSLQSLVNEGTIGLGLEDAYYEIEIAYKQGITQGSVTWGVNLN